MAEKMTFDEALAKNVPEFTGLTPINYSAWHALLTDLSTSLFTWEGNGLDFYDRLLIEKYIHQKSVFCMVRPLYKVNEGTAKVGIIKGKPRIMECVPIEYGVRNIVTAVRLTCERPPKNLIMEYWHKNKDEFILFDNFSLTSPQLLVIKYAEILGRLDALYGQNVDKLGVPIIALCNKTMKNDLINLFKRTKLNALFSLINNDRINAKELFYEANIDFLLDKINNERQTIMKEFLQELGISPNEEVGRSSQYVNVPAIKESSLIAKFFSASMNKYRDNFCDKCNVAFPGLNLTYRSTVQTYINESVEVDNNEQLS